MTYGVRTTTGDNIVSIDEDSWSYVYLGKVQMDATNPKEQDLTVTCAGYPLVFFDVPYNTRAPGESDATIGHTGLFIRSGTEIVRVRPGSASNTWIISVRVNFQNYPSAASIPTLYIRVFGQLHLNFPNGAGQQYGARVWNAAGNLIFDTGCRQLRLAGNTYDIEMALTSDVPLDTDRVDSKDTSVVLPFSMANKSVMANTRGDTVYPYQTGHYEQQDPPASIDTYDVETITNLFWANGNTLYARKASVNTSTLNTESNISIITNGSVTYTRVAILDNSLFP